MYRLEDVMRRQEKVEENMLRNMQKLEEVVKTMRGVEAQVRVSAKKNDWYGEEIQHKVNNIEIELDPKRPRV